MGSILASTIASRAATLLHDTGYDRWTQTEHLAAINDGQKEVCIVKPDAFVKTIAYQLSAGTKQSIPDGTSSYVDPDSNTIEAGIMLLDIVRNMGTDGSTAGNVITLVDMEQLDMALPGWHSVTASATVQHYMFRESNPKTFYVYPKQPSASMGWIEIVMSAIPSDVAAIGSAITLDDIYFNTLLNYVMFQAYSRDADFSKNEQLAEKYYKLFLNSLMTKEQREKADDPNSMLRKR